MEKEHKRQEVKWSEVKWSEVKWNDNMPLTNLIMKQADSRVNAKPGKKLSLKAFLDQVFSDKFFRKK